MSLKKKTEAPLPTAHDPLWKEHARELGWPDSEIATLDSILNLQSSGSRAEHRIVRVTSRVITRLAVGELKFSGTGVSGVSSESTVPYSRYSEWHRDLEIGSIVGGVGEPAVESVAAASIISFDMCACDVIKRKKHHPSCSLSAGLGPEVLAQPAQVAELPAVQQKIKPHKGVNPNQLPMFGGAK